MEKKTEQPVVAICYDFDRTLSPDDMQAQGSIQSVGFDVPRFRAERASIARAILKDSPILIMDDSLSAVDTDTEDNILHNLKEIRQGKTTIMIAHRVSTVQNADHIIFLDNGRMAEYGTYDELVALDGQFARLVRKQQLEKQLAQAN